MKKQTYADALRYANAERKKQGKPPLDFLPKGKPLNGSDCPLARAGVVPTGAFVSEFDTEADGFEEIDPWILVENGDPEGDADVRDDKPSDRKDP